jgi:hypothetical protein
MYTRFLLALALLCLPLMSFAQDTMCIIKRGIVVGRITEMGEKFIKYQTVEGVDSKVLVEDIKWLVLQNGTRMRRARAGKKLYLKIGTYQPPVFGSAVISIAPFCLSTNGIERGLAYECRLDTNGVFGLLVPFSYSHYGGGIVGTSEWELGYINYYKRILFSLCPTLKIYPWGSKGTTRYSTGLGLYLATGNREYVTGYPGVHEKQAIHHTGVLINNTFNLNATEHVYVGFEVTTGAYRYVVPSNGFSDWAFLLGTCIRLGYRF